MNDDAAALATEAAYLRGRETELKSAWADALKVLGDSMGVVIAPEDVTPEVINRVALTFVDVLRKSGNLALAEQYLDAFTMNQQANRRFRELIGQLEFAPSLTADDMTALNSERGKANDAQEQFERVAAAATTWIDRLDSRA